MMPKALPQRQVWFIAASIVGLGVFAALAVSASDELAAVEDACVEGATWHYLQAASNTTADQGWHYGAAKSLEAIHDLGGSCDGWKEARGDA